MIDKIIIKLKGNKSTKKYLNNLGTHKYSKLDTYYSGMVGNLKIMINKDLIVTINGSLTKYYFGNNIELLNTDLIELALEKLADELHLKIDDGEVKSIEFGRCFFMNNLVSAYIEELDLALGYKDYGRYINSITYYKTDQELRIYDKIVEMRKKREKCIEFAKGKNVLRIEIALIRNIRKILNQNLITAEMLKFNQLQSKLLNLWFNEYKKIQPKRVLRYMRGFEPNNPTELKNSILLKSLLQTWGLDNFLRELDRIRNRKKQEGLLNDSYDTRHYRMRNEIKKLRKSQNFFEFSDLLEELDKKMINALDEFWYSGG